MITTAGGKAAIYAAEFVLMSESDYWVSLEFRLTREFAGLLEGRHRNFWCDGLSPSNYVLDGPSPRITGFCWICNGSEQAEWTFALLLPEPVTSRGST
jgi:hypothetical protein